MKTNRFAVVFDLDGTLIDATQVIVEGFNHVLQKNGVSTRSNQDVLRMMGRPLPEMFSSLVPDHQLDTRHLVHQYLDYSRALKGKGIRLLPGALDLLNSCRQRCRVGVNTSRTTASARRILAGLGINHLLPEIVGLDQVSHPKPHPEGLKLALSRLGVLPANAIMLGDTPDDVLAARAAGARAFGVATGFFSGAALSAAGAEAVFFSLASFEACLDQLESTEGKIP